MAGDSGAEFSGDAPFGWKPIETPITISWSDKGKSGESSRVSFQTAVRLSWIEILSHLPPEPNKSWNRIGLLKVFSNSLAGKFRPAIERRGFGKIARLTGHIDSDVFDQIVAALVRAKILRFAERPKYVKQQSPYWLVTEAGLERIQEARRTRADHE
jgi:hypothetical protein